MENLLNDPQVIIAIGLAIAGLIGGVTTLIIAIAFFLRTNATIRQNREERLASLQETDNKIKLLEADGKAKDEEHRRTLDLVQAQITAERENQTRQEERRLEQRLLQFLESRIDDLESRLGRIKEERDDLRLKSEQQSDDLVSLQRRYDDLKRELDVERDLRLDLENGMRQIQTKLAAAERTVAEQERKIRALEKANGDYDDDTPPSPPPIPTHPTGTPGSSDEEGSKEAELT